jgi:hypothetical protein
VGIGTYTSSGTTLSRTTVLSSSNGGSLVNFTAGTKDVFVDYPASKAVYEDASGNIDSYPITGGTINGTTVGATTASTGRFSDLTDTGLTSGRVVYASTGGNLVDASNFTYDGTNLVAGAIQNTPIGATTPAAGVFTTLTAQTEVLKGTGQNLVVRSQALATSPWTAVSGATVSNDTTDVTDPLGGSTASKIVSSGAFPAVFQSNTLQGIVYTASIYLRTLSGTVSARIVTSLSGSPYTAIGSSSITITSTWQRFSYTTSAPPTSTTYNFQIDQFGTNTFYAWGAQLEIGSNLNTYIPTTTTAVYGTPTLSFSGVASLGLQSDGSLYVQPAGTGALQAQATTSSATGGNARGANAVDWQTSRGSASQVASGSFSVLGGGFNNSAGGYGALNVGGAINVSNGVYSSVLGGYGNNTTAQYSSMVGGFGNAVSSNGQFGVLGGGSTNTLAGYYNVIVGGFTNSATSGSAVTTQSGTMNATTAVTLSGSNANIKVGQYITGTSISGDTYVAAISGTSLTLSKVASGSSTSTLSFFTPHGVVVGGGNNTATGSYSFIGGGGDAGTAGNRNVASGDWSAVVGGFVTKATGKWSTAVGGIGNTASGEGSVVVGGGSYSGGGAGNTASSVSSFVGAGYGNTANGYCSTVVGGSSNTASNNYSFVGGGAGNSANTAGTAILGGFNGTARSIEGLQAIPACNAPIAATQGCSQAALLILGVETTNATATVLRSNTSAASTNNQVILPNNSAYYFKGSVIANVTGGGNTKAWAIEGAIKRGANAASTALVGSASVVSSYADAGASTWAIAVTADTTNGGLAVTFTGQASTTIRCVAKLETTEVTF